MHIALLAVENCLHSCITGPQDMFHVANMRGATALPKQEDHTPPKAGAFHRSGESGLACQPDQPDRPNTTDKTDKAHEPPFITSVRTQDALPVHAFGGTLITPDTSLTARPLPDVLILPAIFDDLADLLANVSLITQLRDLHRQGTLMASVCAGSFLLAAAGILDGRDATTHWNLTAAFQDRFPAVTVRADRMLVDGGDYICAGGVTAYLDLTLYLLSRYTTSENATSIARLMLIDPHRDSQTPYCMGSFRKNHGDTAILHIQQWLEEHYPDTITLPDLAARANLGERTFLRRFRSATGETPVGYVQRLRTDAARRLLESTPLGIEEITAAVGYTDAGSFRKLFRTHTGMSPGAYRDRFAIR